MSVKLRDRDRIYQCWRVAAIYRCVLRYGMGRDWALDRIRELDPSGRRDHMIDLWFMGLDRLCTKSETAPTEPMRLAA